MSYQVDYTVLEWWSTYATCPHEQFANEIAAMLLSRGETVRVSEIPYDIKLGPTQIPKAAGAEEQSSDSEPRHSPSEKAHGPHRESRD